MHRAIRAILVFHDRMIHPHHGGSGDSVVSGLTASANLRGTAKQFPFDEIICALGGAQLFRILGGRCGAARRLTGELILVRVAISGEQPRD